LIWYGQVAGPLSFIQPENTRKNTRALNTNDLRM
jgi:hypothetical protein